MIIIPSRESKKLVQTNRGDVLGLLWSTWNIDLQANPGAIRVGNKMKLNTNTAGAVNLGLPVAFRNFDSLMFCVAGSRVFKSSGNNLISAFSEDGSGGDPTTCDAKYSDAEIFENKLFVSTGSSTTLSYKPANGSGTGIWSSIASAYSSTFSHKLAYLKKLNRLYWSDNNTEVKSLSSDLVTVATSGDYFIDLGDNDGSIATIAASSNRIWIGMIEHAVGKNNTKGASIFEWDGISNQALNKYSIDAQGALAIYIRNDIPFVMDSAGRLLEFRGSGFEEVGRLPIDRELLEGALSSWNLRFIHPNGLTGTKDNTILALVQNVLADSSSSIKENLPSGIWEWSRENGFVHKHAITLQPMATTTVTDNGQNKLYVNTGSDLMGVGALVSAPLFGGRSSSGRSDLICGARYYTDATTDTFGIFIKAPFPTDNATTTESKKYGYFVTQWIPATNIRDSWKKIALRYKKLLNSSDRIILKSRVTESDPTYIDITWVNTTSFTTTTDVSAMVGYEVEVLQGTGSGKCSHITAVTGSGTYTVTVDETYTGVTTGTAKARVQAWKKLLSVADQNSESKVISTLLVSERLQLKVCMEFTGNNELHEVIIVNSAYEKLE